MAVAVFALGAKTKWFPHAKVSVSEVTIALVRWDLSRGIDWASLGS